VRRELITREIHTHWVYHRVLPVIETEILPAKHYIKASDESLIPIPESEVPRHSISGSPNGDWQVTKKEDAGADVPTVLHTRAGSASHPIEEDGAIPPVVGYTRGERPRATRSRGNSLKSISSKMLEPILSSKKEYITKEGYPRTEYVWRHPPVFETTDGKTHPIYMAAGTGNFDVTGENVKARETGAVISDNQKGSNRSEEALLFRDSGYGFGGMLPSLEEKSPMAGRDTDSIGDANGNMHNPVSTVKMDENGKTNAIEMTRKPVGETEAQSRRRRSNLAEMENSMSKLSMRQ